MADGRKRKRKAYSLQQMKTIAATAVRELESIFLNENTDTNERIRAINSLSTLINSYSRLIETADLEERISELEIKQLEK